ncbi:hypothetical protein [Spirosoma aerophilum]
MTTRVGSSCWLKCVLACLFYGMVGTGFYWLLATAQMDACPE